MGAFSCVIISFREGCLKITTAGLLLQTAPFCRGSRRYNLKTTVINVFSSLFKLVTFIMCSVYFQNYSVVVTH